MMTRRTNARGIAAFILLAAAGAAAITVATPVAAMQIGGGWRATSTDDGGVQGAGAFLAEQAGGELASVDSAQYQSAAGTNYRLEITLADGARWSGQVRRDLQGNYSMMGSPSQLEGGSGDDGPDTGSNQAPDEEE